LKTFSCGFEEGVHVMAGKFELRIHSENSGMIRIFILFRDWFWDDLEVVYLDDNFPSFSPN
jgi:hypothetical protein